MRDPTRSAGIRRQGRAMVARRVHYLHQSLRYSIQEEDVAGLRRSNEIATRTAFINWFESVSHKLARAEDMIQNTLDTSLMMQDWTRDLIERSIVHGIAQVEQELQASLGSLDAGEVSRLHAHAALTEVRGIAGETQRRLLRHVVHALDTKQSPEALMREVRKVLEKVTKLRLNLLINTHVVRAVNAGKLFGYEALGIRQVGISPEWLPHVHPVLHDAKRKSRKAKPKKSRAKRVKSIEEKILEAALGERNAAILEQVAEAVEEEVLVNVLTAGDDKVCEECSDIAAEGPYDIDKAKDLIPAHPNCRCAFVPWSDKRFAPIQEQIEEEEDF
jgi:hypothetical protein